MSIKQTYIEARQKGTKTIQGNNNGDFTTILNRPIMMRSNDELTLVNAFVDTIDITDNHILVEEDTTIEIAYYMYDTMGGQNSKLGNLGNDDQKKVFGAEHLIILLWLEMVMEFYANIKGQAV